MPKIFEPFKRMNKFDFDADSSFDSYAAALAYAQDPLSTAYFGQRIFVKSPVTVEGSETDNFGDVYTVKKKYTRNAEGAIIYGADGEPVFEWYLDRLVTIDNFVDALDESKDSLIEIINKNSADISGNTAAIEELLANFKDHEDLYNALKASLERHVLDYGAHAELFAQHITEFQGKIDANAELIEANTELIEGVSDRTTAVENKLRSLANIMSYGGTFTSLPTLVSVADDGTETPLYTVGQTITVDGKEIPLLIGTVVGTTAGKEYVLDADASGKLYWLEFGDVTQESARVTALELLVESLRASHVTGINNADGALKVSATVVQDENGDVIGKRYTVDAVIDDSIAPSKNALVKGNSEAPSGLKVPISTKQDNAIQLIGDDESGNFAGGLYVAPTPAPHIPEYSLKKLDAAVGNNLASYKLCKDGTELAGSATINIPKDLLVKEGSVVTFATGDTIPDGLVAGTYIKLILQNNEDAPIYIDVTTLIEYVTGGTTAEITVSVSADHKVTATINDYSIAQSKLTAELSQKIDDTYDVAHEHANEDILDAIDADDIASWNRETRVYRVSSLEDIEDTDLIKGDIAIVTANVDCETVTAINSATKVDADWNATTAYTWDPTIDNGVDADGTPIAPGRWVAFSGNCSADNVIFSSDFVFTTKIGTMQTLSNGSATVPAAGKSITQFFSGLFAQEAYPSATAPSVSWNTQPTGTVEVGTEITPSYNAKLNAGSYTYGPATGITAKTWSVSIANTGETAKTTSSGSFSKFIATDGMSGYAKVTATASYDAGTVPVTNIGNRYPSKQIGAGSKSATAGGYTAYRAWFYGYKNGSNFKNIDDINSEYIRGLTSANGTFTSSMSTNKMQQMFFAAPAGVVKSVVVKDATNGAPQTVKQKTVYVTGAKSTTYPNGYTAPDTATVKETTNGGMAYDLFYVSNDNANSGDATYNITVTKN